ncbi:transcobalamin-2 isoform X2 [Echeneis naucrates]|uniref:transcobalamin-2 isoform X2 n=1 Tax=Echeneis naucrates TaxID=173247 RepID=UPI00111450E4|nr:transcobalamin-2-like isoform X2 [Echeneis naucrates]
MDSPIPACIWHCDFLIITTLAKRTNTCSLSNNKPVTGRLALYIMALKSSCYDLVTATFTVNEAKDTLLTNLKRQMELEKEHILFTHRPLTNYFQYSLGVLALCVSGIRVNNHVSNKLIKAVEHRAFKNFDMHAMAGMALQCVKDSGSHVHSAELDSALIKIKQTILASARVDGHFGNEFSTGLAVQALLAMGDNPGDYARSLDAIRTTARSNTYHNPMAISQILPALQHKSYLTLKTKECLNEDNTLLLGPTNPVVVLPSDSKVDVNIEVVTSNGAHIVYSLDVPKGSSLLEALELLNSQNAGFTFETETSLWGPFLSTLNGEQARQGDRRYWHLSSDGTALKEGIGDFRIEAPQKITIRNTSY